MSPEERLEALERRLAALEARLGDLKAADLKAAMVTIARVVRLVTIWTDALLARGAITAAEFAQAEARVDVEQLLMQLERAASPREPT